jgi:hypothetical protein
MSTEGNPLDLLGREPDGRLLGADLMQLPATIGEPPEPLPESPARRRVVRFGATMTGVTLIGGIALALLGLVELISEGGIVWLAALVIGIGLAATHWGWVHVAELSGDRIEGHRHVSLEERQRFWLSQIEPCPAWEITTRAGEDGSITIATVCHRPVPLGDRTFTFSSEEVAREVHSADEPAAEVTERAELLRRQAAADTEAARGEFETARDAYEEALMIRDDDEQQRAALRAASEALSERLNTHLRDPPLAE